MPGDAAADEAGVLTVLARVADPRHRRTCEQVEAATLNYVDWFNRRRLFETCGDIPPAELETAYYRQNASLTEASQSRN